MICKGQWKGHRMIRDRDVSSFFTTSIPIPIVVAPGFLHRKKFYVAQKVFNF